MGCTQKKTPLFVNRILHIPPIDSQVSGSSNFDQKRTSGAKRGKDTGINQPPPSEQFRTQAEGVEVLLLRVFGAPDRRDGNHMKGGRRFMVEAEGLFRPSLNVGSGVKLEEADDE